MGVADLIISTCLIFRVMVLAGERSWPHLLNGLEFLLNLFYSSFELTELLVFHNIAYICYFYSNVNTFL